MKGKELGERVAIFVVSAREGEMFAIRNTKLIQTGEMGKASDW